MTRFEKFKAMTIEDLAEALFDNDITCEKICSEQSNVGKCSYSNDDINNDKIDFAVCKRCFIKYSKGEAKQ